MDEICKEEKDFLLKRAENSKEKDGSFFQSYFELKKDEIC